MLPKPMNTAFLMTNEIVMSLYSNHNIGGNSKNQMLFCRSSVEKYLFGKIYPCIFALYKHKYELANVTFDERSAIIKTKNPVSILKHLGVNKKFII